MGNRNSASSGYASVATDEEAPSVASPPGTKQNGTGLPVEAIEPVSAVAGRPAVQPPKKEDDKPSRFSAESLKDTMRILRLIVPYVWPKNNWVLRMRVMLCLFLLILSKVASIMIPAMYRTIVNTLPARVPVGSIVGYGLLRLAGQNLGDLRGAVFVEVENYATRAMFRHLHELSLSYHLMRNTGGLLRTMQRGAAAVVTIINTIGFTIIPSLFEFFIVCIVVFTNFGGFWFSLLIFMTIIGYAAYTFTIAEWRSKFRKESNEKENESNNAALDSLLNYETVKYFTAEMHETKRYDNVILEYCQSYVRAALSYTLLNIGQGTIITAGLSIGMGLAAKDVADGKISLGDLVAINAYIIQLYGPLGWLGGAYRMIVQAFTDLEKMFEIFDEKPEVKDKVNAPSLRMDVGQVEFRNVSFSYPARAAVIDVRKGEKPPPSSEKGEQVLDNVSFVIPGGKTLAVVGPSGSGKTTLSRLLCRFYDPSSGSVLVDSQDVRDVTQLSLRSEIGVVPQDTVLFNDSIEYNIGYGAVGRADKPHLSIEEAAKEAQIHEFVMSTKHGYATKVGERGLRLSGGEKQRVAIDPTILILDEATSALDSKNEREIQDALYKVSKGRTTLIIAHRLSTVVDADEIMVLKKGKVVEKGSHRDLLQLDGEYSKLWAMQVKEASTTIALTGNRSASPLAPLRSVSPVVPSAAKATHLNV